MKPITEIMKQGTRMVTMGAKGIAFTQAQIEQIRKEAFFAGQKSVKNRLAKLISAANVFLEVSEGFTVIDAETGKPYPLSKSLAGEDLKKQSKAAGLWEE